MSISRVGPSSFSPEVELVGLLICASYIARSAPGLGQLQHPLAFSGTSHIFQLQLHLGSPQVGDQCHLDSSIVLSRANK